jgi:hypothetical protein
MIAIDLSVTESTGLAPAYFLGRRESGTVIEPLKLTERRICGGLNGFR